MTKIKDTLSNEAQPAIVNPLLPAGRLMERVVSVLPNAKFTASDIAEAIGYKTQMKNSFYETCPQISKILLKLCKQGVLYQWVIGTGGGLDGMTYNSHKWELYYVKRDSNLAKQLLESRGKYLSGYRFR